MTEYKIIVDVNDIVAIYQNGDKLSREEAYQTWIWLTEMANICQLPEEDD